MLYALLKDSDAVAAQAYLTAAFKLIDDIGRECAAPPASVHDGTVDWGSGGWETVLMHSTIDNNAGSPHPKKDHGLVYADYYWLEFANEAIKLKHRV